MAENNTLWVGGLADEVTEDHLYELFLQAGPLQKVVRPKEKDGSSRKFAFVEFSHAESVPYAIQIMDGIKLFNQNLRLKGRTGSSHDSSRSDSPSFSHSYNRSRSYQGDERRGAHTLSHGYNIAAYSPSNMQPQSFEERRNRLLFKQSMSHGAHSHNHGGHNYAHSFNSYGQQSSGQPKQQWYLDNY